MQQQAIGWSKFLLQPCCKPVLHSYAGARLHLHCTCIWKSDSGVIINPDWDESRLTWWKEYIMKGIHDERNTSCKLQTSSKHLNLLWWHLNLLSSNQLDNSVTVLCIAYLCFNKQINKWCILSFANSTNKSVTIYDRHGEQKEEINLPGYVQRVTFPFLTEYVKRLSQSPLFLFTSGDAINYKLLELKKSNLVLTFIQFSLRSYGIIPFSQEICKLDMSCLNHTCMYFLM